MHRVKPTRHNVKCAILVSDKLCSYVYTGYTSNTREIVKILKQYFKNLQRCKLQLLSWN